MNNQTKSELQSAALSDQSRMAPREPAFGEWAKIEDGCAMPERVKGWFFSESVIVSYRDWNDRMRVTMGFVSGGEWYDYKMRDSDGPDEIDEPLAWMPLPNPPESKE